MIIRALRSLVLLIFIIAIAITSSLLALKVFHPWYQELSVLLQRSIEVDQAILVHLQARTNKGQLLPLQKVQEGYSCTASLSTCTEAAVGVQ